MSREAILSFLDEHAVDIVRTVQELVRIPTVNPYAGDSTAGTELPGQEYLRTRLDELGIGCRFVEVPPDVYEKAGVLGPEGRSFEKRPCLVAELELGPGGRTLILNGHMDTVGAEGMEVEPFSGELRDGYVWGRGSTDCKGGLTAGLWALAALKERAEGLKGRIVYESVVDEECNGSGAGTLACIVAGVKGDAAIVVDGSGLEAVTGCEGILTAEVRVRGEAVHSSRKGGVNAIDAGITVKRGIDSFAEARAKAAPELRVNLGVFRAGSVPAVVPSSALLALNIGYRFEEAREAEGEGLGWGGMLVRRVFEREIEKAASGDDWLRAHPPELNWVKDLEPYRAKPGELLDAVRRAQKEILGGERGFQPMKAWFDASHIARRLRVPVVGLGPGLAGQAHTGTEHVRADDVVAGAKLAALAAVNFLGGEG